MTFVVERKESGGGTKEVSIEVSPDSSPYSFDSIPALSLDVPGLGLAYPVGPKVASVVEGSPAAKAQLRAGTVLETITFHPVDTSEDAPKLKPITFSDKSSDWPHTFSVLQAVPLRHVELKVKGTSAPIRLQAQTVAERYNPWRGLHFQAKFRVLPPQGIQASLRRGFDDTVDNILRIYAMLRSLVQQRVSPKLLGGPIMIANVAYSQASTGLTQLVHFLGILSINLAVLNFLPVPPLDGGQMVFLIAEKVRGRPLPESAVIAGSWVGIAMLLLLMVYVMYQDIARFFF